MLADTEDKVLAMLQAGAAVIAARGAYAREKYKDDAIPPGDGVPMLYILLDEFATTCKGPKGVEILDAATKISQTGRSVLVGVDIYTQHGASGAFGASSATQLIAQCGIRGCFRLEKNEHARFVFPSSYSQIDTSALPLDGTFYLSTRGDELPTKQRAYALYKPADVRRIADRLSAGTRPRLDEPSATAAAHVLGNQYTNTTNDGPDQPQGAGAARPYRSADARTPTEADVRGRGSSASGSTSKPPAPGSPPPPTPRSAAPTPPAPPPAEPATCPATPPPCPHPAHRTSTTGRGTNPTMRKTSWTAASSTSSPRPPASPSARPASRPTSVPTCRGDHQAPADSASGRRPGPHDRRRTAAPAGPSPQSRRT